MHGWGLTPDMINIDGLDRTYCITAGVTRRHMEKGVALGKLFERLLQSLQDSGDFPSIEGVDAAKAKPEAQTWTMFQLALHYDMQGRTGKAVDLF